MSKERVTYLFRKPKAIPIESTNKIRSICTMREKKFQSTKSGTFSFKSVLSNCEWSFSPFSFLILKKFYKGFQMRYHLSLNSVWKVVKLLKTISPKSAIQRYMSSSVYYGKARASIPPKVSVINVLSGSAKSGYKNTISSWKSA